MATAGAVGYERPPLVTSGDINPRGGWTTLGSISPAFSMLQSQAQAAGAAPVLTGAGPTFLPVGSLGAGVAVLLLFAWYLDRRVL
jgi:hypothetical protein